MMPDLQVLEQLIHAPVEWAEFYGRMEVQGRLSELAEKLFQLPPSSVRDARIARIWWREGRREEARELVYQHKGCNLCKAWYFTFLVTQGEEATLRMVADHFRPDWSLGTATINLEAKYRAYLNIAIAANTLKRHDLAQQMYFNAFQIADVLGDQQARKVVVYEMAWMGLFNNQLEEASSKFRQLLTEAPQGSMLRKACQEYASVVNWLLWESPVWLPDWAQHSIRSLQQGTSLEEHLDRPQAALLPYLVDLFADLRQLTEHFYLKLPLFHVQENQQLRQQMVQRIRTKVGPDVGEINGFIAQSVLALAMSMEHDPAALDVLKRSFRFPTTGIAQMGMLYFATLVQLHANLPQLAMGQEVRAAFHTLVKQYRNLPAGPQQWLLTWMKQFTPVTLYLMAEQIWQLRNEVKGYVVVTLDAVHMGDEWFPGYPRHFMTRHILHLLAGGTIPLNNKMQAHRHRRALQSVGVRPVIFQPILDRFASILH